VDVLKGNGEWIDGWVCGWMDGWMNGWMDIGYTDRLTGRIDR